LGFIRNGLLNKTIPDSFLLAGVPGEIRKIPFRWNTSFWVNMSGNEQESYNDGSCEKMGVRVLNNPFHFKVCLPRPFDFF
jgi:hypothetical protein